MKIAYKKQDRNGLDLYVLNANSYSKAKKSARQVKQYAEFKNKIDDLVLDINFQSGLEYALDFNDSDKTPEFFNDLKKRVEGRMHKFNPAERYDFTVPGAMFTGGGLGVLFGGLFGAGDPTDTLIYMFVGGLAGAFSGLILGEMATHDFHGVSREKRMEAIKYRAFNNFYEKLIISGKNNITIQKDLEARTSTIITSPQEKMKVLGCYDLLQSGLKKVGLI